MTRLACLVELVCTLIVAAQANFATVSPPLNISFDGSSCGADS